MQDCVKQRKGPYDPDAAEKILADVLAKPEGSEERRAELAEAIKRFVHKGQIVQAANIEGPLAYKNGRTGLILHTLPDEKGRFTIELNEFDEATGKDIVQKWLRVPATNIRLQVGMHHGLFGDFRFEKAAEKAGHKLPRNKYAKDGAYKIAHPAVAVS